MMITVPTARAIPSRDGREQQLVGDEEIEEVRGARLSVATNNRNPNFATKVMSNGVEVIVAGKNPIFFIDLRFFTRQFCFSFRKSDRLLGKKIHTFNFLLCR